MGGGHYVGIFWAPMRPPILHQKDPKLAKNREGVSALCATPPPFKSIYALNSSVDAIYIEPNMRNLKLTLRKSPNMSVSV